MTISSSLLVDRTQQIQLTDNAGRAQGEVFANQLSNLVFADFASAEGFNQNGNRMCYADSVCQLDFAFICQTCGNDIFSNVTCSISSTAVNLRGVLAAESTAAMTSHAAIGINDDFTAGQTSITLRTADNETTGRVDVVFGFRIQHFCGNNRCNNLFDNIFANLLVGNFRCMLGRNNDSIYTNRFAVIIFNGNLSFAVRTQVRQHAFLTNLGQLQSQLVSQICRHRHVAFGFVGCITEHHALVAGTGFFLSSLAFLSFQRFVNAHSDIRGLLVDRNQHAAGVAVKAEFSTVVADVVDGFAGNVCDINIALGRNFTENVNLTGSNDSFASNTAFRILSQDGIKHSIGNLVCYFIGMTFGNGFGSK